MKPIDNTELNQINELVEKLWEKYDSDKAGLIDDSILKKLIFEISQTVERCKEIKLDRPEEFGNSFRFFEKKNADTIQKSEVGSFIVMMCNKSCV